jgi:hypothetical protein
MTYPGRIPQVGDRVLALGQNGTFTVSDVDHEHWTVELRLIGRTDFKLQQIRWGVLDFLDQEKPTK